MLVLYTSFLRILKKCYILVLVLRSIFSNVISHLIQTTNIACFLKSYFRFVAYTTLIIFSQTLTKSYHIFFNDDETLTCKPVQKFLTDNWRMRIINFNCFSICQVLTITKDGKYQIKNRLGLHVLSK